MPETKRVNIAHLDGREYSILPADFTNPKLSRDKRSYADQGFEIVAHVDGTPYVGPRTKREIEQAAESRQAAREAQVATKATDTPAAKAEAKGKDS